MTPLPPHVKAYADALVECAPPLTPGQERLIQRALGRRPQPAPQPQAA